MNKFERWTKAVDEAAKVRPSDWISKGGSHGARLVRADLIIIWSGEPGSLSYNQVSLDFENLKSLVHWTCDLTVDDGRS